VQTADYRIDQPGLKTQAYWAQKVLNLNLTLQHHYDPTGLSALHETNVEYRHGSPSSTMIVINEMSSRTRRLLCNLFKTNVRQARLSKSVDLRLTSTHH